MYTTLAIVAIIYVLSVVKMFVFMRNAHSKGGKWSSQNMGILDVSFVLCPCFNTVAALIELGDNGKEGYVSQGFVNKLFGVKK